MLLDPTVLDTTEVVHNYGPDFVTPRPRTRGDCVNGPRPCPWVSCRHHLFFDEVKGKTRPTWPGLEPHELPETCSLDVADREEINLADIGRLLNVTRERVRQIESRALAKLLKRLQELNDE